MIVFSFSGQPDVVTYAYLNNNPPTKDTAATTLQPASTDLYGVDTTEQASALTSENTHEVTEKNTMVSPRFGTPTESVMTVDTEMATNYPGMKTTARDIVENTQPNESRYVSTKGDHVTGGHTRKPLSFTTVDGADDVWHEEPQSILYIKNYLSCIRYSERHCLYTFLTFL